MHRRAGALIHRHDGKKAPDLGGLGAVALLSGVVASGVPEWPCARMLSRRSRYSERASAFRGLFKGALLWLAVGVSLLLQVLVASVPALTSPLILGHCRAATGCCVWPLPARIMGGRAQEGMSTVVPRERPAELSR